MNKKYLEQIIEITTQLKHLQDLYVLEVDNAKKTLKKNELDENELEYKSVEMMNYFVEKLERLTEEIIKQ